MSILEDKKVYVNFLYKDKSLPKQHPLYGGKHDKAGVSFSTPRFENKPIKLFTDAEAKELSKAMDGEDLSALASNKFWESGITRFSIGKEGMELNMNNPIDVIRYKIITHPIYSDLVGVGKNYSKLCKYAISTEEDSSTHVKSTDAMFNIVAFYGKYEDNADVMKYIYWKLTGSKLSENTKISVIREKIKELIDLEKVKFSAITKEIHIIEKALLFKALNLNKITNSEQGFIFEGTKLFKGTKGNFESSAEFLADVLNQPIKHKLQGEVS